MSHGATYGDDRVRRRRALVRPRGALGKLRRTEAGERSGCWGATQLRLAANGEGAGLSREAYVSGVSEWRREPGEDRHVDVQRHPVDPAHPEGQHGPLMLQAAELTLDTGTGAVQGLPTVRLRRDERVQPVSLDPHRGGGALARGAAVLGRATLGVGTGEGPDAVLALRRGGLTSLDVGRLPERDDGADTASLAPVVERTSVVPAVSDGDGRTDAVARQLVE